MNECTITLMDMFSANLLPELTLAPVSVCLLEIRVRLGYAKNRPKDSRQRWGSLEILIHVKVEMVIHITHIYIYIFICIFSAFLLGAEKMLGRICIFCRRKYNFDRSADKRCQQMLDIPINVKSAL